MSHPSCEKQDNARFVHIGSIIKKRIGVEVIAYVIQCHNDHDDTAQKVNGFNSLRLDHNSRDMIYNTGERFIELTI